MKDLEIPPDVEALVMADAPVAVGVSGGKDSCAAAIAVHHFLEAAGHRGKRLLIHADLGLVEWADSGPTCERLAAFLGWELAVVQRRRGGMMERWEERWEESIRRYRELECVKVILPWSTPSMRFCTAELKRDPITSYLKKRFGQAPVLSVSGVRADESVRRSKMPVSRPGSRLRVGSVDWNAILRWNVADVWVRCQGFQMHEAYGLGNTRVSCVWCIMGCENDFRVASMDRRNDELFRRMTALEIRSGFAFQGEKWLAGWAPERADGDVLMAMRLAVARQLAEAEILDHLLYVKGWPVAVPSQEEAELLARVRKKIFHLYGWESKYVEPTAIRDRYAELMILNAERKNAIS